MTLIPILRRRCAALLCAGVFCGFALLRAAPAYAVDPVFNTDGIAIEGTDPVAYFTDGKPISGDPAITYDYAGATWRFTSAANRDAFAADPAHYAPQYGGYCAWAVSRGYTAPTVAEAWRIEDGKLYLNYSKSVQRQWSEDIPGNVAKADANWPGLRTAN